MFRTVLAAALLPLAAASPRPATVFHDTVWFRGAEPAPRLQVTQDLAGHCVGPARSTHRTDAWRCFAAEHWIDPCFSATSRSRKVLCPFNPWSEDVRLVELTRPLPRASRRPARANAPWGIWTTNAKRCVLSVSGANLRLAGHRVRYGCGPGSGFIVGYADVRGREWTIGYVPRFDLGNPRLRPRRVGITDVWR